MAFSWEKSTWRLGLRECSDRNDVNRRGTREKSKRAESDRHDGRRERFQHVDHCYRWHRSRSRHQMHGDMGGRAERAVRMGICAVRMGMRDLHGTRNDDQKDTDEREE